MKEKDNDLEKVDLLEVLLDETNTEHLFMYDEKGRQLEFEQVAVLPRNEEELYCILKPITKLDGIGDDEAIVFKLDLDDDGEYMLKVETDELTAIKVFDQYYQLLEEERKKFEDK